MSDWDEKPYCLREAVIIDEVIQYLNELVRVDPIAVTALVESRVSCNQAMAEHPSVQVSSGSKVGMLGVLNGLFGVDEEGWGAIAAEYNEGKITQFFRTSSLQRKWGPCLSSPETT